MSIEGPKFQFSQKELKNNNFNPELEKFLKDKALSKEEADVLTDMFEENKANIILISKHNLTKLRKVIGSKSKTNYITNNDKKKIASYVPKEYNEGNGESFSDLRKHISKNGFLKNVSRIRLDQLIGPSKKIKFSIKISNNSIYKNSIKGNTYNVIWGRNIKNGKQTYIFENGPLKGRKVIISNGDQLLEYGKSEKNLQEKHIKSKEHNKIEYKNISERNKNFIDGLKLPRNYKKIALEFASKLKHNEILNKDTPIALVDGSKKEMLYTIHRRKTITPILIGKNGLTRGGYRPNDKKTPVGRIHRFNTSLSKIARSVNGDASNSGHSKTVLSASLQSDFSTSFGGRYFHGVAQYRINGRFKGMGTWGCVGVNVNLIRKMYRDVKRNGKGYGYVG